MAVLIANNATGVLAGSIDSTQTEVSLQAGEGSRFPSPSGNDWFPITFVDPDGLLEIMHCTSRSNDVLTVSRGREGTSAKTFASGDRCALRVTAAAFDDLRTPKGGIIKWSGAIVDIPTGWALCDGNNGTLDLTDKFVVAAGGGYAVGDTGGADSVTLTAAQMPSHNHGGATGSAGGHNHGGATGGNGGHTHTGSADSAGSHNHSASTGTSGGHSHSGSTNTTGSHRHNVLTNWSPSGTNSRSSIDTKNPADYHGLDASPQYSSGPDSPYLTSAGNHSHSLSINSNGAHTHSVSINSNGAHTHNLSISSVSNHTHSISTEPSHTHSISSSGGDGSHENRPPYYALAFIQKL